MRFPDFQNNKPRKTNMKKLLFTLTLAVALAAGNQTTFAQAKKKKDDAAPAEAAKPKADAPAKAKKDTIPMYVRADEIDASAKTITQVSKDGKKAVNTVTDKTEIHNGEAAAKFEDIKKGDMVSGLRKKTGEGAYEVVKITKFGPAVEKKKDGEAKKPAPAPKKKP